MLEFDEHLERLAREGDADAAAELFEQHREQLVRFITLRRDKSLRSKFDAIDVVQETLIDCVTKAAGFFNDRLFPEYRPSTYVWLRMVCQEKLIQTQRRYLETSKRDVSRERGGAAVDSCGSVVGQLVDFLVGRLTAPSSAARRTEDARRLWDGIERLPEADREFLVLRHIEGLTGPQVGEIMGVSKAMVSRRVLRATEQLRTLLTGDEDPDWAADG